jgi:hypothetical protein
MSTLSPAVTRSVPGVGVQADRKDKNREKESSASGRHLSCSGLGRSMRAMA